MCGLEIAPASALLIGTPSGTGSAPAVPGGSIRAGRYGPPQTAGGRVVLTANRLLRLQLPEDFAQHAEQHPGVCRAEVEAAQHAAKLFFGCGRRARGNVTAQV